MKNIDINRIYKFMGRQMVMNSSSLMLAAASVFGSLLLLTMVVSQYAPMSLGGIMSLHMVVFFVTGYLLTSKVFSEMNDPKKGYFFLTIPVSTLEKVIGSWIITSPLYVIGYFVAVFLIFISSGLITGIPLGSLPIFQLDYFQNIPAFLVGQTVFFLGASYFKGNNFLKTILSIVVLLIGLIVFFIISGYALFMKGIYDNNFDDHLIYFIDNHFINILFKSFWYIIGPFLLMISYFRLKERQI